MRVYPCVDHIIIAATHASIAWSDLHVHAKCGHVALCSVSQEDINKVLSIMQTIHLTTTHSYVSSNLFNKTTALSLTRFKSVFGSLHIDYAERSYQFGIITISLSGNRLTVHIEYNTPFVCGLVDALCIADLRPIVLKFERIFDKKP